MIADRSARCGWHREGARQARRRNEREVRRRQRRHARALLTGDLRAIVRARHALGVARRLATVTLARRRRQ